MSRKELNGWITHTDLASDDPVATKAWCAKVLGWTFKPSMMMPEGEYHLFMYSNKGGGGIHQTGPSESPGTLPYVSVPDTTRVFDKAIREGAEEIMAPNRMGNGITLAIVRAPGGVAIGIAGP
ncbi:MAG: VOC family protein [Candidatus Eiseniibacteriota bacterium]